MLFRSCCLLCMLTMLLLSSCRLPVEPITPPVAVLPTGTPAASAVPTAGATPANAVPTAGATPAASAMPAASPSATAEASSGLALLGAIKLNPANRSAHADVAGYKDLAFVGKWQGACPATGVDIIDISDPAAPVRLSSTPERAGMAMEDIQAAQIGSRDVLAVGLQACRGGGQPGLELIDISDPRSPQRIGLFATEMGVHEFGLAQTAAGQTLALLAVPGLELNTAGAGQRGGEGDLLIVDISDPAQPRLASEWGVLDEPALGVEFARLAQQGSFPGSFLHSVRANASGTRAYLSYWDAGTVILDIGDPTQPRYLGRTSFAPEEEGNAHSIAVTPDDTLLVQAEEDFSPRDDLLTSSAFSGSRSVYVVPFAGATRAGLRGELVHVGRGCPAGSRADDAMADAYLADPSGKIALLAAGDCRADEQIARAQLAGATGAIIYGGGEGASDAALFQGDKNVELADGTEVTLTIPAAVATPGVGRVLVEAAAPVSVQLETAFSGWGGVRLFDISDPASPVQLSQFATPNATDPQAPSRGPWSAHNPDLRATMLYTSWYRDGIRALDLTDPANPREVAAWTGQGRPDDAPAVNIWGVVAHGDLVLASDFNYGLYILTYQP